MKYTGGFNYVINNAKKRSKQHIKKDRQTFNIMNLTAEYLEKIWKEQNRSLSIYWKAYEFKMDKEKPI